MKKKTSIRILMKYRHRSSLPVLLLVRNGGGGPARRWQIFRQQAELSAQCTRPGPSPTSPQVSSGQPSQQRPVPVLHRLQWGAGGHAGRLLMAALSVPCCSEAPTLTEARAAGSCHIRRWSLSALSLSSRQTPGTELAPTSGPTSFDRGAAQGGKLGLFPPI